MNKPKKIVEVSKSAEAPCYVAVFRRTVQTSEDTWRIKTETHICSGQTKLSELIEWKNQWKETAYDIEITEAT